MGCEDCGAAEARIALGGVDLCDACYDVRVSKLTGWPPVGPAPAPLVLVGPDGRTHELAFRVLRGPAGVEARLEETTVEVGQGYEFAVLGDHGADVAPLVAQAEAIARREVGRLTWSPPSIIRDGRSPMPTRRGDASSGTTAATEACPTTWSSTAAR